MSKKKSIAVAIVLLLVLLIGGMLAFFTDTDKAENVFTLGDNIEISLIETGWTEGTNDTYTRTDAEGIHPAAVVAKDPTIVNDSLTTPAYVFAEVIVPCYDTDDADSVVDAPLFKLNSGTTASPAALGTTVDSAGNTGWTLIKVSEIDTTNKTITYVYAYGTSSAMTELAKSTSASEKTKTPPVFTSVTLEPTLTAEQKATAPSSTNIVVNAYGIQIDNLGTTSPTAIYDIVN